MLYNTDFSSKMYERLSELEEKLLKSEAERKLLEAKFQFMAESYKSEEERRLNNLRKKYAEFMEDCNERSRRNDDILKSLQKVENGANAVFAKTERMKQLRSHYDAYLARANPLWRHPEILQLQPPHLAQQSHTLREPQMNIAVTRPALLLPGGGAVMLPVDESGMAVAQLETQNGISDIDVRQLRLSQSIASAKDAKIISTLGEAGQRMMHELKLIEGTHYSYLMNSPRIQPAPRPVFYQSYHLPVYIPPLYGPTTICAPPPTVSCTAQIATPTQLSYPLKTELDRCPERIEVLKKKAVSDDKKTERSEKSKDTFEIECLAADGNYAEEDDANLSDDEVLDVALGRSQSPFRNGNPITPPTKPEWTNQPAAYSENLSSNRAPDHFENAGPVAKKIPIAQMAHQKSIEELKAILSFEEDAEPLRHPETDVGFLGDEDVPEDFIEQNYTEPNYDPRFQRDVSRNVILEEDEEDEEEKPVAREDEWRHSQERDSYSGSSHNRIEHLDARNNVEKHEPPKSPQQYAQQFKALNKSPSQANIIAEPTVPPPIQRQQSRQAILPMQQQQPFVPAQIQRQPSRVAVMAMPPQQQQQQLVEDDRFHDQDLNNVSGFSYERKDNVPQSQTAQNNEFANMSDLHGNVNMERDDFIRDTRQRNEFHGSEEPVYDESGYGDNFEQQQQFENTHHDAYDSQLHYDEPHPHPVEQFQDYQPIGQPIDEYYGDDSTERYVNPEQEVLGNYQQGEPMHNYYPEQPAPENQYPDGVLENFPQNEFYGAEMNQTQYAEQYGSYDNRGEHDTQFYEEQQQQDMYAVEGGDRAYSQQPPVYPHDVQAIDETGMEPSQVSRTDHVGVPKSSILNQLIDSESESYQVDPAGSAHDDSDFDFSIGKP